MSFYIYIKYYIFHINIVFIYNLYIIGDTVTNAAYRVPPSQVMKVREITHSNGIDNYILFIIYVWSIFIKYIVHNIYIFILVIYVIYIIYKYNKVNKSISSPKKIKPAYSKTH